MAKIAYAKEEIIPKSVDRHHAAGKKECGIPPDRRRQEKEPVKDREKDRVIECANHDPAGEGQSVRR